MRRALAFVAGMAVVVVACSGSGNREPVPVTVNGTVESVAVASSPSPTPAPAVDAFDDSLVHAIELEVNAGGLAKLTPGNDERVRARLVFDGKTLDGIGLRLKGGDASRRPIEGKAGFSVDTDAFVDGLSLGGVTRLTLGNAVNDPSFVTEALVYEVFRDAGIVAPRTALATVRLNGETLGLYVMREGYDKAFLRRTFAKPGGNLYEGDLRIDVTNVEGMGLRTNEAKNDRSDLAALAVVVASTPDDGLLEAVGAHVDLEQLLTYWAVEAITHHWDGYVRPNNYYVYHDPATDRLVFLAHGADWAMLDVDYGVLARPGDAAVLANRLYANAAFRERLGARIAEVLERNWRPQELLAHADRLAALVRSTGLGGSREEVTLEGFERELAARKAFVAGRADVVRRQLEPVAAP